MSNEEGKKSQSRLCVKLPGYFTLQSISIADGLPTDLEHGNAPETKRRVTEFYFQRLQNVAIAPISLQDSVSSQAVWSKPPAPGVPPIRLTSLESPNGAAQKSPSSALKPLAQKQEEEKGDKIATSNAGTVE